MTYSVGQSKVRSWNNCRQAYHWKYEQKLQRRRTKRPFMFGKIVHRMIEAKAQAEDPFGVLDDIGLENQKLFAGEREMYGDIVEDIRTIMSDYFGYHRDGLRFVPVSDETGEMRFAEHEFAVPLEELVDRADRARVRGIVFKGQVDGLGKTPNKLRWLIEHKTFDKLPGDDERWRNLQSVVYIRAVRHLGWLSRVDGVCWNYIKSHAPTVPAVLKDGTRLSAAKITTLPSVVRRVLKEAGLSEKSGEEQLRRADESRREYFQRIYTPVSRVVSDNIFSGFVESACEMRDDHETKKTKNIGRHCSWCDYEPLCRTELTGGDVDFVREGEFEVEDPEAYRRSKRTDKLKVVK